MKLPQALATLGCGLLLVACAHQDASLSAEAELPPPAQVQQAAAQAQPIPEVSAEPPGEPAADQEPPPELPTDGPTPQQLYDQCGGRLENPEAEGECTTDADCGRAGCSQEACVAASRKGEVMTTCEVRPCFGVLEACTCQGGLCRWTLEQGSPSIDLPRIPIPAE